MVLRGWTIWPPLVTRLHEQACNLGYGSGSTNLDVAQVRVGRLI